MNSLLKFLWIGALSFVVLFFAKWGRTSYVFYGDALGYYYYLPATFVYHNFHQIEKLPADRGLEHHVLHYAMEFEQNPRSPKGYLINQYTYGVALMETSEVAKGRLLLEELFNGASVYKYDAACQIFF